MVSAPLKITHHHECKDVLGDLICPLSEGLACKEFEGRSLLMNGRNAVEGIAGLSVMLNRVRAVHCAAPHASLPRVYSTPQPKNYSRDNKSLTAHKEIHAEKRDYSEKKGNTSKTGRKQLVQFAAYSPNKHLKQ